MSAARRISVSDLLVVVGSVALAIWFVGPTAKPEQVNVAPYWVSSVSPVEATVFIGLIATLIFMPANHIVRKWDRPFWSIPRYYWLAWFGGFFIALVWAMARTVFR